MNPFRLLPGSLLLTLATLTLASIAMSPEAAIGGLSTSGMWTPPVNWSNAGTDIRAVHLVLLPGGGTPHSRVLFWVSANTTTFGGREWAWSPGTHGCDSFPTGRFVEISVPGVDHDLFCTSHVTLGDGNRVLMAGGTDPVTGLYGENRAQIFTPGSGGTSGSWSSAGTMVDWRWYPAATVLKTGEPVLLSGVQAPVHRIYGGRRNGSAPASTASDSLYRFLPVSGGDWKAAHWPAVEAGSTRPAVREGHTFVRTWMFDEVMFGGRDANGVPKNDLYSLIPNDVVTDPERVWRWKERSNVQGDKPVPRTEHSAVHASVDTNMVVFGGIDGDGTPLNDVHRLHFDIQGLPRWDPVTISGIPPSARYGHSAIHDSLGGRSRMIVFGGSTASGAPTDPGVYELHFTSPSAATWTRLTEVDLNTSVSDAPAPRRRHAVAGDPFRNFVRRGKRAHVAFVYGGELSGGAYSDSLWALWMFDDNTVAWERVNPGGSGPGSRARLTMTCDPGQDSRLYLFGGENGSGQAAGNVYTFKPWTGADPDTIPVPGTWSSWEDAAFTVAGHTAMIDPNPTNARRTEIFNPGSGTWTAPGGATLFQHSYPPTFVVPGNASGRGRILSFGVDDNSYFLDVPAGSGSSAGWKAHRPLGFAPVTGALYRPGRIMVAGSENTVIGTTKILNASDTTSSWVTSASMEPRSYHNLVLLPSGTVMAVGGSKVGQSVNDADTLYTERRPQIWDPDGGGGTGTWSSISTLAQQGRHRGYHSTALLLPDGRVLSGGGEFTNSRQYVELFCPPYLYLNDTLATRPVLDGSVQRVRYGQKFSVCSPFFTYPRKAVLMRPGATTHAFDQNQRYVPLSFDTLHVDYGSRLIATAPGDSSDAPPGDYLLFILNLSGVPAVAKWIRLGSEGTIADNVRPGPIPDFAPEILGNSSVTLTWTSPGDDSLTGVASQYDLRRSTSQITPSNFYSATPVASGPTPGCPLATQSFTVGGLASSTKYWFGIRTSDEYGHLSRVDTCSATTVSTGGGGGGAAAVAANRRVEASGARPSAHPMAAAGSTADAGSDGVLVAGYSEVGGRVIWKLTRTARAAVPGLRDGDAGTLLQTFDGEVGWKSHAQIEGLSGAVGLGALRDGGRAVFLNGAVLEEIAAAIPGHELESCDHSRLGGIAPAEGEAGIATSLVDGDTVVVTYHPASGAADANGGCHLRLSIAGASGFSGRPERELESSSVPAAFAFHHSEPNPFGTETVLRFDLPRRERVRIDIYDVQGRRVHTLANREYESGYHRLTWDGRDAAGRRKEPGVYYSRIEAGPNRAQGRIVFLP